MKQLILDQYVGFEWDSANETKNANKHQVSCMECEQVFFNIPILLHEDTKHSMTEQRSYVLGQTDESRKLFMVFTRRKNLIRIISARDMNKKERNIYEKAKENTEIYL